MGSQRGRGGKLHSPRPRRLRNVLLALAVQPLAVLAERPSARALHDVIRFDVVPLRALVVVVVHVRGTRRFGVPGTFVTHHFTFR